MYTIETEVGVDVVVDLILSSSVLCICGFGLFIYFYEIRLSSSCRKTE